MSEKKKNKTWGPIFCLFILVLDVFKLLEEQSQPSPDQTLIILYEVGVVAIVIAFVVSIVRLVKEKKAQK